MRQSDMASSSHEREEAATGLIQTEVTNAVNTGLVSSSDHALKSLKDPLYGKSKQRGMIYADDEGPEGVSTGLLKHRSHGTNHSPAVTDTLDPKGPGKNADGDTPPNGTEGVEDLVSSQTQARRNLSGLKTGAKTAAASRLTDYALDDSELDTLDDAYYAQRGIRRVTGRVRNRLAKRGGEKAAQATGGSPGPSSGTLGQLAEKKYRVDKASPQEAFQRQHAQAKSRQIASSRLVADRGHGVRNTLFQSVGKGAAGKAGGGALAIAGVPVAAFALIIALVLVFFLAIIGAITGGAEDNASVGDLGGVEAQIAQELKGYGFTNEAIAGVLGNLSAESGMDPTSDVNMDGMFNYAYERACGLFQYTSTSPGSGEYWNFKNWCSKNGKTWSTVAAQMEWTFSNNSGTSAGYFGNRWMTGLAAKGYYSNCPGYTDGSYYATASAYKKADDAAKAAYSWMACYERPANGQYAHLDTRIEKAKEYLKQLNSGQLGSNAIVEFAYSQLGVPYVWGGETAGVGLDCSGLTMLAYRAAGITISHYTGDQYKELKHVKLENAQPGDILYRSGHVAIYIGNDQYIHAPHTGDVVRIATGINSFTCALRAK